MKLSADLQGFIRGEWNWSISCLNDSETQEISWGNMPPNPPINLAPSALVHEISQYFIYPRSAPGVCPNQGI